MKVKLERWEELMEHLSEAHNILWERLQEGRYESQEELTILVDELEVVVEARTGVIRGMVGPYKAEVMIKLREREIRNTTDVMEVDGTRSAKNHIQILNEREG